jgi:hypothetical protein
MVVAEEIAANDPIERNVYPQTSFGREESPCT